MTDVCGGLLELQTYEIRICGLNNQLKTVFNDKSELRDDVTAHINEML